MSNDDEQEKLKAALLKAIMSGEGKVTVVGGPKSGREPEGLGELLRALGGESSSPVFHSEKDAMDQVMRMVDYEPDFKPGDRIERNEWGKEVYKLPDNSKNQVAVYIKDVAFSVAENGHPPDGLMAVAMAPGETMLFPINKKFYKKFGSKQLLPTNVTKLKPRKKK